MSLSHNIGENQRTVRAAMDKDIESADEGQRNSDRWSGNHYDQLARVTAQALPELKLPSVWIEMGGNESETRQSVRKEKQRVNERRVTHYCQIDAYMVLPMDQLQWPSGELEIPYLHLSKGLAELPIPCTSDDRASQQDTGLQSQFQTTESVVCEESLSESDPNATCGSGFFRDRSNEGEEWSRSRQSEATESSTFPRQESLSKYNPDEICESTCRPLNSCSDEEMQTERESNSCDQREATESVPYQESLSQNDPDATCWAGYWQQAIGIEMGGNESETRQSVRKEKQRVNERRVTHYCQIDAYMVLPMDQLQWPSGELEIPYLHLSKGLAELPIPCTSDDRASQQDTGLQSQFQTTESVVCEESLSESDPNATCGSGFFRDRSNEGEEWSRSRQSEATESSTFPRQESLSKYNPDEICESTCRPLNSCSDEEMQTERESNSCDQREATESVPYQESLSQNDPDATCGAGYWQQAIGSSVVASFNAYLELPCLIRRDEEELWGGHVLHDVPFQPPIPPREQARTYEQNNSQEASVQGASQKSGGKNSKKGKKKKGHYVELAGLIAPELAKLNGVMNGHSEEHETTPTNGAAGIMESEGVAVLHHMHATSQNTLVTSQKTHTSSRRSRNASGARAAAEYCRLQVQEQQKLIDNMAPELQAVVIEMIRRDEEELGGSHVLHDVLFQPPIPPREQAGTYEQNNSQEASVQGASQKSGGKNSKKGKKKKGHYVELAGLIAPELAKLNGVMNGHSEEHETTATNGAAGTVESDGVSQVVVGYSSQGENSAQHGTHHNGAYSRFPRSSHQGLWGGTSRDQSHAQTSQPNRQGRGNGNHSMGKRSR